MPLPLICDEHIPYQVVQGLLRRGIDVLTIQQLGLRSAEDEVILQMAEEQQRVIYTRDTDFLRHHAAGTPHPGIIYHHPLAHSFGSAIRVVALTCEVLSLDEIRNRVEFL